jgi:hypothetical protein
MYLPPHMARESMRYRQRELISMRSPRRARKGWRKFPRLLQFWC